MVEITRDFATAIFIVYENRVLLHIHKKLNFLLPVGGHIDENELPDESALREVKEESGLFVELYCSKNLKKFPNGTREINYGEHLNVHKINELHEHICFVYYAKTDSDELNPQEGESTNFKWYSKEEIESSNEIRDDIKFYALEALEKLKN